MNNPLDEYIAMFGVTDLIPVKWFFSKKYKSVDEVYAECVKRGITWRELTKWNMDKRKEVAL